jgi:hypothetical protein
LISFVPKLEIGLERWEERPSMELIDGTIIPALRKLQSIMCQNLDGKPKLLGHREEQE